MQVESSRRVVPMRVATLWVAAVVAAFCCSAAVGSDGATPPLKLGGTWLGSYSGPVTGTFTLTWIQTRSVLRGTITLSNPHGTYRIDGSIKGTKIKFGAVGVGAVYTGSVAASGLAMSGTWTSTPGSGTWKAHKRLTAPKKKVTKS